MSEQELPPSFESVVNNETNDNVVEEPPPPYDTTNSNAKFSKHINIPDHEIVAVKQEYVSRRHDSFCVRDGFSSVNSHTILVIDSDGKEVFTLKEKPTLSCVVVYDIDKSPILNAYIEYRDYKNIFIFSGKKTDGVKYSIIRTENNINDDIKTFTAGFLNKSNNREEELEIRFAKLSNTFEVYCNPNTPNEILVCTITKNSKISKKFDIEIAPGVDYMFMIGLTAAFIRLENIAQLKNITKKSGPGLIFYYM